MPDEKKTGLAFVDGRDALAFVIIRPSKKTPGEGVQIEAAANGISHATAAYILRHVADQWDPPKTGEPDAAP